MLHACVHLKDHYPILGLRDCDPTVEVFIPNFIKKDQQRQDPLPALLILPGGGYLNVAYREGEPIALDFMARGYATFVLNYSVKPHTFPTALRQVAAAIDLICKKASDWDVDSSKIAIMGFSAGGHLAGHYSNCYDCPEVREIFPNSYPVKAAVLCYPVITCDPRYRHVRSFIHLSGNNPPTQEDELKFSLEKLVTERTPPTFLWHTREDSIVPVMNSLLYAQALTENGIPFSMRIYPFGSHGMATADERTNLALKPGASIAESWMDEADRWLKMYL